MNNQIEKIENQLQIIENQLGIMRDLLIKLEKAKEELEISKGILIIFRENNKKEEMNTLYDTFYDGNIKLYRAISNF
jgi:prefoldin subunit 5